MKKQILIAALTLFTLHGFSQDTGKDPYAIFGHKSTTKYETRVDELLYIKNWDTTSLIKAMAFNLEKQCVIILGKNDSLLDKRFIKPEQILRFISSDPLSSKYPASSPYNYTDNNPILRIDPDGRDWIVATTTDKNGNRNVHITFTGAILNSGSTSAADVAKFKTAAEMQIKNAYTQSYTGQANFQTRNISKLDGVYIPMTTSETIKVNVTIDVNIHVINDKSDLASNDHLIEIVPKSTFGDKGNSITLGQAGFYGKHVQINEGAVADINSGVNQKTVPHELGHTAGLFHPNEGGGIFGFFVSPQHMKDGTQNNNLMYQTGYQHGTLNDNSAGNYLNINQVKTIQTNFSNGKLNQNNIPQ